MKPDDGDVYEGMIQVLCKAANDDKPFGVAWMRSYHEPSGRRYAMRPKKPFYRRGRGGVQFKVLKDSFIPLDKTRTAR